MWGVLKISTINSDVLKNHRPNPKCSVKAQAIKTGQTARALLYINFLPYVNVLPEALSCFLFH